MTGEEGEARPVGVRRPRRTTKLPTARPIMIFDAASGHRAEWDEEARAWWEMVPQPDGADDVRVLHPSPWLLALDPPVGWPVQVEPSGSEAEGLGLRWDCSVCGASTEVVSGAALAEFIVGHFCSAPARQRPDGSLALLRLVPLDPSEIKP